MGLTSLLGRGNLLGEGGDEKIENTCDYGGVKIKKYDEVIAREV